VDFKVWLSKTTKDFELAGVASPRLDALILLEHVSGIERSSLLASDRLEVDETLLFKLVQRRLNREPLAYIISNKEFYGHSFFVDNNVLIPRPESEAIVEYAVLNAPKSSKLVDVGTGSGAIAISIKLARDDLEVSASDISSAALKVARKNASSLKAAVTLIKSDLLSSVKDDYQTIVANLPYVPPGGRQQRELAYEPELAIYDSEDGLGHYRQFSKQLNSILASGGLLIVEHDLTQIEKIKKVFTKAKQSESVSSFVTAFKF